MSAAPVTVKKTLFAKRYSGDLRRAAVLGAIASDEARRLLVVETLVRLVTEQGTARVLVVCGSSEHASAIESACREAGGLFVRAILASGTEAEHREVVHAWESGELDAVLVPIAWLEENWWKRVACGALVVAWPIPASLARIIERTKALEVIELNDGFTALVSGEGSP